MSSLRSGLGRVKGLGSAKEGVHHWRLQRLTAVLLIPLALWFLVSMLCMVRADYATVVAWIAAPHVTVLLLALSLALFCHLQMGLQVVVEDYVHDTARQIVAQIAIRVFAGLGALLAVVSILKISLGMH